MTKLNNIDLNKNDFLVFQVDYWTDEVNSAVILLELIVFKLNSIKIHQGPKIFYKQACDNFIDKFGLENCYVLDDFLEFLFSFKIIKNNIKN